MRRVFGCLVSAILLFTAIYFAGWWFQSPRLDISTPAKQGLWRVKRVYLAERESLLGEPSDVLFASGTNIVIEFEDPPRDVPEPPNIVVVTPDGASMWVETRFTWDRFGDDSKWYQAWEWIASRTGRSKPYGGVWRGYIPISYLPSVRYLDIYPDSPEVANIRWRLANLPRPEHVITHSVKNANCYRSPDFEVCARARRNTVDADSFVDVTFDIRIPAAASADLKLYFLVSRIQPEWLTHAHLTAYDPPRFAATHSGLYTVSLRIPFARHQHYLELDCVAMLVRYRNGQRQVSLPIRKIRDKTGRHMLVLAAPREKELSLIGGRVYIPSVDEYSDMSFSFLDPPTHNEVILFYWREWDWSVADETVPGDLGVEGCSITSSPGVPFPYQLSHESFSGSGHGGSDLLRIKLPHGVKNLRQIPINFKGRGIIGHSKEHWFTLTTRVEEE